MSVTCVHQRHVCVQGGAVIDKVMVIKYKHGAGLYDCHEQQDHRPHPLFKPTLLQNQIFKPDKL